VSKCDAEESLMTGSVWVVIGSLLAGLGVGMGAFGAHGLKDTLQTHQTTAVYETAAQYQMYHSLAILAVGLLAHGGARSNLAGWCFVVGILLFSGSLYILAMTGIKWLGAITPFGGVAFLIGWGALAWTALRLGR
jgi:uncharacterized membrane protein YgdD (TMEM256/DUF423 family)